jgi:hypothetical protein
MATKKPDGESIRLENAPARAIQVLLAWAVVSLPLAWGVYSTLKKAAQLFQ